MSYEFCAYPFLEEDAFLCDYEIATDVLASQVSLARHDIHHIPSVILQEIIDLLYHANGSIRGKCAINQEEVVRLKEIYDQYETKITTFVLPDGCIGASQLHVLRAQCKAIIRLMVRIRKQQEVAQTLFDFMNLLSNTFFMMSLYENKQEGYSPIPFISRSYV